MKLLTLQDALKKMREKTSQISASVFEEKGFTAAYGFNTKLLSCLKAKVKDMDEMKRHGGIVVDEMKLSAHLDMQSSTHIEGFVDLGKFTDASERHEKADHGLVIMFQPFVGKWTQIIGVFSSSGNVKARLLTKILIEATILCEQAGLYLDYICCDGAPWNRSMWNILGVRATLSDIQCRVVHPCDKHRFLYLISDFPHLMKCVRNTMMKQGFNTHNGRAHWDHVSTMWKLDNSAITLKVAPKLTRSHIFPNGFEKMRVDLAFHVFSPQVSRGLDFYQDQIEARYANVEPTRLVIGLLAELVEVMTSRFPEEALRLHSRKEDVLDQALKFLDLWEAHAKGRGFLSKSTAVGLRVTLQSTKHLLKYLTEEVNFKYLMTARLSQDCLERCFGIVRQAGGGNDHPTPAQFVVIMRCLSFYSLAKSPKGGNVADGVLESLLSLEEVLHQTEGDEEDNETLPSDALEDRRHFASSLNVYSYRELVHNTTTSLVSFGQFVTAAN
ncbi:hypothetical protein HPB49_004106 [Dermacentor silvarum]|uniref:Uncharacterized protein n=1 Tax=Dermacentor silvarum TaxID=543639 RepID=A0ACB8DTZ4_DERSI|nr:hypothetical protein HPB49_004106 [Dermacentor silvarum]